MNLRVKEIRERHGLSKTELANRAAIDPATLWRIEANQVSPQIQTLEAIANGLGVEVRELFPKKSAASGGTMFVEGVGEVPL